MPEGRLGRFFRPKVGEWDKKTTWTAPSWEEDHATDISIARQLAEEEGREDPFATQYPLEPVTRYEDYRPKWPEMRKFIASFGRPKDTKRRHPFILAAAKVGLTAFILKEAAELNLPLLDPTSLNWPQLFLGTSAALSSLTQTVFPESLIDGTVKSNIKKAFRQPIVSFYAAAYSIPAFMELANHLSEAVQFFLKGENIQSLTGVQEGLIGAGSALGLAGVAGIWGFSYIPSLTQIKESLRQARFRASLNVWNGQPHIGEALLSYLGHREHPEDITRELESAFPANPDTLKWLKQASEELIKSEQAEKYAKWGEIVYWAVAENMPRIDPQKKLSEDGIRKIKDEAFNRMLFRIRRSFLWSYERAWGCVGSFEAAKHHLRDNYDQSDMPEWLSGVTAYFCQALNDEIALSKSLQVKK